MILFSIFYPTSIGNIPCLSRRPRPETKVKRAIYILCAGRCVDSETPVALEVQPKREATTTKCPEIVKSPSLEVFMALKDSLRKRIWTGLRYKKSLGQCTSVIMAYNEDTERISGKALAKMSRTR
mmetsp:Transcript_13456/g.20059  ORF Transcript_13456/g.20059 Transcript_13456/m.20059 type:complete len:125 (-) Transcript_13456:185-559(-)